MKLQNSKKLLQGFMFVNMNMYWVGRANPIGKFQGTEIAKMKLQR